MENNSRISEAMSSLKDKLGEQQWFQELKGKWEELDPQSRMYLRLGSAGVAALALIVVVFSTIWNVYKLKSEVAEKAELLSMVQNANDELKKLKETNGPLATSGASNEPWPGYIEGVAATNGIGKGNLSVSDQKAGASGETIKESLIDVKLNKVSLRQVIRLAYALEYGTRPVKLRNLSVDTKADPEGYMDATLSISAFTLASANK